MKIFPKHAKMFWRARVRETMGADVTEILPRPWPCASLAKASCVVRQSHGSCI